jgi:hypothetical protein
MDYQEVEVCFTIRLLMRLVTISIKMIITMTNSFKRIKITSKIGQTLNSRYNYGDKFKGQKILILIILI